MVEVSQQRGVTVVVLGPSYASLDEATLEDVGGLILTTAASVDPPRLLLDMSATEYIGSAFIELLVRVWKRLTERGGAMAVCGLKPLCRDVLRVSRVDGLWEMYPSRAAALQATAVDTEAG